MYQRIMVPVDLAHTDRLEKALSTAADLSRHYGIPVCYVGVTTETPSSVAHNPEEYAKKLETFAHSQASAHGNEVSSKAVISHDLSTDLDKLLLQTIRETGSDLVIMASHMPGLAEHFITSNAGYVASHAKVSVFVVR